MDSERIDAYTTAPQAMALLMSVERYLGQCSLEPGLIELIKFRVSQINGCAFCLEMHSREAREQGESEMRLYLLDAWRESHLYSPRERAALEWCEELTLIADRGVPDERFEHVREHFSELEIADLTLLIGQINTWNRFAIGFRYRHA